MLPAHLKRVCMKNSTAEERDAELERAKDSQREWTRVGRRWEYQDLVSMVPDDTSCKTLLDHLKSRGFFVIGEPVEDEQSAGPRLVTHMFRLTFQVTLFVLCLIAFMNLLCVSALRRGAPRPSTSAYWRQQRGGWRRPAIGCRWASGCHITT